MQLGRELRLIVVEPEPIDAAHTDDPPPHQADPPTERRPDPLPQPVAVTGRPDR